MPRKWLVFFFLKLSKKSQSQKWQFIKSKFIKCNHIVRTIDIVFVVFAVFAFRFYFIFFPSIELSCTLNVFQFQSFVVCLLCKSTKQKFDNGFVVGQCETNTQLNVMRTQPNQSNNDLNIFAMNATGNHWAHICFRCVHTRF